MIKMFEYVSDFYLLMLDTFYAIFKIKIRYQIFFKENYRLNKFYKRY